MIEFERQIEIGRSASEVFALLVDPARMPAWQDNVIDSTLLTPGPLRAGSEFMQTWRGPARQHHVLTRIAAFRDGEVVAFAGDAAFMDFYCAFEVAPAPSGTVLTSRNELRLHGLWRIAQPLVAAMMRHETDNDLSAFKRLIEASTSAQMTAHA